MPLEININAESGYRFYRGAQGAAWQLPLSLKCGGNLFLSAGVREGQYGANSGAFEIALFRHASEFASGINLQEYDMVEGYIELTELAKIIVFLQGKTLEEINQIVAEKGYLPIRQLAGLED